MTPEAGMDVPPIDVERGDATVARLEVMNFLRDMVEKFPHALSFAFGDKHVQHCAEAYNVPVMPLRYFTLDANDDHCVHPAFSNTSQEKIREDVSRFSHFVHDHFGRKAASG